MERKADFKIIKKLWCELYLLGEVEMVISCLTHQHLEISQGSSSRGRPRAVLCSGADIICVLGASQGDGRSGPVS